jgi:predicted AAA+ superfamily ATPase
MLFVFEKRIPENLICKNWTYCINALQYVQGELAMFKREVAKYLVASFKKYPVISINGPRQSGKTTLAKDTFPELDYVNLEDPSVRMMVENDPKGFLDNYKKGLIIDEAQNVPSLFSYLQVYVDQRDRPGQYVLTGSQQFLLNENISQTLAGRVAIFNLLPLSYRELDTTTLDICELMYRGFYPRLYRYDIAPQDFYPSYIQTYLERDVRMLANITDLGLFQKFIYLCAGRVGQILNVFSLANDCGISAMMAKKYLSILQSSYVIYLLQPYYENVNKRVIKSPKLYFYDSGLVCSLLNIQGAAQLQTHYSIGAIFENYILIEMKKFYANHNKKDQLYYLRNKNGQEVDVLIDGSKKILIEIKFGKTFSDSYLKNIEYWSKLLDDTQCAVIYNGDKDCFKYRNAQIFNWQSFYYIIEFI